MNRFVKYGSRFYSSGLFNIPGLHQPSDFQKIAAQALRDSTALRETFLASSPSLRNLSVLDQLSNTLCRVIDVAEFCRNVHTDPKFVASAEDVCLKMGAFMEKLNVDVPLYQAVCRLSQYLTNVPGATEEQLNTLKLMKRDLERHGIHLSERGRSEVADLHNEIMELNFKFQRNILEAPDAREILLDPNSSLLNSKEFRIRRDRSRTTLSLTTDQANHLLYRSDNEEARKYAFITLNSVAPTNLAVLEQLVEARYNLAKLLSFESFSQMILHDRMANSTESAENFLYNVWNLVSPQAQLDHSSLINLKRSQLKTQSTRLNAWDLWYYQQLAPEAEGPPSWSIRPYFTIQNLLNGLDLICKSVWGVRLEEASMSSGESWGPLLRKVEVYDEDQGRKLGTIYLDLFSRPGKAAVAAHYTLTCGFKREDFSQLPVIGLVMNFDPSSKDPYQTSLAMNEAEVLFHEFGHAMHTIFGQCGYQHVSGTRTVLEFAEIPSHLFENFIHDYRVVSKFAIHPQTKEPVSPSILKAAQQRNHRFQSFQVMNTVIASLFDLRIFGPQMTDPTALYKRIHDEISVVPHVDGTHWFTKFSHLCGYAGGYYTYLFSNALSSDIWQTFFVKDPLSRENGQLYRDKLLSHGGSRDASQMMLDLLGRNPTLIPLISKHGFSIPDHIRTSKKVHLELSNNKFISD